MYLEASVNDKCEDGILLRAVRIIGLKTSRGVTSWSLRASG